MQLIQTMRPENLVTIARRYPAGGGKSATIDLPDFTDQIGLMPGAVMPVAIAAARTTVELGRRIAPWCDVILAPRIIRPENAGDLYPVFETIDGMEWGSPKAMYYRETLYLSMQTPRTMLDMVCHEAWHGIERRLSPAWKDEIDESLAPLAYGEGHPYWGDPEERRCRAFEAWCGRMIEGISGFLQQTRIDEIFAMAWTGELGEALHHERKEFA